MRCARKIEEILAKTEGVEYFTTIAGYSLLSSTSAPYTGFYLRRAQALGRARRRGAADAAIMPRPERSKFGPRSPRRSVFAFAPPAIPGIGTGGGFSFLLQDRSGGTVEFLAQNLQKFLEAARKRPELARRQHHLPRRGAPDLRRRRPRQGAQAGRADRRRLPDAPGLPGRHLRERLQPLRPPVEGLPAGRGRRTASRPRTSGQFYVRNNDGNMVPLSAVADRRSTSSGPEFTTRFNLFRAAQVIGQPGARATARARRMEALEEVARRPCRARWATTGPDLSYQEKKAAGRHGGGLRASRSSSSS